jgi:hypothetical protein
MSKKTIIIFITVFIATGAILLGLYFYFNKNKDQGNTNTWYQNFNPFGTSTNTNVGTNVPTVDLPNQNTNTTPETTTSRFYKITDFAVAGATFFDELKTTNAEGVSTSEGMQDARIQGTEIVPSLKYVEKKNGHIYKMPLDTKVEEKISNSTIPNIYEAFFDSATKTVVYRYLSDDNTISSFMATLGANKGEFLPQNIYDISISIDKNKFFYLTKNSNGSTGAIGSFGSIKREIVFNSPFTEWLSEWDTNQKIFLTTKPSYSVQGGVFLLNPTNKTTTKILGGIAGLTTKINKKGSMVLYSSSTETGPKLGVFDINKHTTKDLDSYGLSEKCVWALDDINIYCAVPNTVVGNQYPDYWYQGLISFDDYFVKINTITGDKATIANSVKETPVDGTYLFLSSKEDSLFFINKKDSTLWSLDVK